MIHVTFAKASPPISRSAAWLAICASVLYQTLLIAMIFMRPDLAPSWHSISEWAIGPHGWLASCTFLVGSLSYCSLAAMLVKQLATRLGKMGLVMLLICAAGVAGVGVFTTDPMPFRPPLTTRGTLHVVSGSIQMCLFPFAALLISVGLGRAKGLRISARKVLRWIGWLPLLGFLCFIVYTSLFVAPLGPHAYGPGVHIGWPPRIAFFTYSVWIVVLAAQALSDQGQSFGERTSQRQGKGGLPVAAPLSQPR